MKKCSHGEWGAHRCQEPPEHEGATFCAQHRVEALARVKPRDVPRPWPGVARGSVVNSRRVK